MNTWWVGRRKETFALDRSIHSIKQARPYRYRNNHSMQKNLVLIDDEKDFIDE